MVQVPRRRVTVSRCRPWRPRYWHNRPRGGERPSAAEPEQRSSAAARGARLEAIQQSAGLASSSGSSAGREPVSIFDSERGAKAENPLFSAALQASIEGGTAQQDLSASSKGGAGAPAETSAGGGSPKHKALVQHLDKKVCHKRGGASGSRSPASRSAGSKTSAPDAQDCSAGPPVRKEDGTSTVVSRVPVPTLPTQQEQGGSAPQESHKPSPGRGAPPNTAASSKAAELLARKEALLAAKKADLAGARAKKRAIVGVGVGKLPPREETSEEQTMGNFCAKKPAAEKTVDVGKKAAPAANGTAPTSNGAYAAKPGEKKQFSWEKKKAINKADYMIMDKKDEVGMDYDFGSR